MSNRDPVKILKPVAINNSLKGKREKWRIGRKWWTWNGTISNSCYLCSPHQNLTNAFSFLLFKCWHFHPSFYDTYFKKSLEPGPWWRRLWQQMMAGDLAACFQSGTWSLPVSWLCCYQPLLDVSQWCLLNQNQSRCSWHHPNFIVNLMHTVPCLNLQLPTPASIFSFCGKGVHKCITVPSEEFWHPLPKLLHISNLVSS